MNWNSLLVVGAGGAIGSMLRFSIGAWFQHRFPNANFPWSTFAINVVGSLCIGIAVGLTNRYSISQEYRLAIITGFLGGFTTFSSFAFESVELMSKPTLMLSYAIGSTFIGILFAALGYWLSR